MQLVHVCHLHDGVPLWMQTLTEVRSEVAKKLGLQEEDLELSMGMSGDFEQAVSHSTKVSTPSLSVHGENQVERWFSRQLKVLLLL